MKHKTIERAFVIPAREPSPSAATIRLAVCLATRPFGAILRLIYLPPATALGFSQFSYSYQPRTLAKMRGATMVASDSMTYFGVVSPSLPQVIFSLGTAPE